MHSPVLNHPVYGPLLINYRYRGQPPILQDVPNLRGFSLRTAAELGLVQNVQGQQIFCNIRSYKGVFEFFYGKNTFQNTYLLNNRIVKVVPFVIQRFC